MTSGDVVPVLAHLWQSTLFAIGVRLLTLLLRHNGARIRCALWLAASLKFLLPFALLTAIGQNLPLHDAPTFGKELSFFPETGHGAAPLVHFGSGGASSLVRAALAAGSTGFIASALATLWVLGTLAVALSRILQWMQVRRALHDSVPTPQKFDIPVRSSGSQFEPGVVGIVHPVLLLPAGLAQRLSPEEMEAVLAHERCHVARADNLAAALHMLVEAVFWFHPLIWWLGRRIVEERERACDEQVLAEGHAPESYGEGILKVCEHYLDFRLACVAGIGGANLRRRIEVIMTNQPTQLLGTTRKAVIALAACAALVVPLGIGVLAAPPALAQQAASAPTDPQRLTINFRDADVEQVAMAVARATHKTLILDPRVHFAVTIYYPDPISPAEFYNVFLSILNEHGFVAMPYGPAIQIVPDVAAGTARQAKAPVLVTPAPPSHFVTKPASWQVYDGRLTLGTEAVHFTSDTVKASHGTMVLQGHVRLTMGGNAVDTDRAVLTRDPATGYVTVALNRATAQNN